MTPDIIGHSIWWGRVGEGEGRLDEAITSNNMWVI